MQNGKKSCQKINNINLTLNDGKRCYRLTTKKSHEENSAMVFECLWEDCRGACPLPGSLCQHSPPAVSGQKKPQAEWLLREGRNRAEETSAALWTCALNNHPFLYHLCFLSHCGFKRLFLLEVLGIFNPSYVYDQTFPLVFRTPFALPSLPFLSLAELRQPSLSLSCS